MGCSKFKCRYSSDDEDGVRKCAVSKICGIGVPCIPYAQCGYCGNKERCAEELAEKKKGINGMKIIYEAEIDDYYEISRLEELHTDMDELIGAYIEGPGSSQLYTDYEVSEHGEA